MSTDESFENDTLSSLMNIDCINGVDNEQNSY
jgi:hypothetical protein